MVRAKRLQSFRKFLFDKYPAGILRRKLRCVQILFENTEKKDQVNGIFIGATKRRDLLADSRNLQNDF